jgi:hypothetical protein
MTDTLLFLASVALRMHLECRLPFGNCHEFIKANWDDGLANREEYAITEGQGAVPVDCLEPQSLSYMQVKTENFN